LKTRSHRRSLTRARLRPLVWLLLITPAAESLVGRWRAEHDDAARFGIPAHVTVRTPFLPPEHWRDPAFSRLERFLPTDVTLARLENRPGGLVIIAEPDDELREITEAVGMSWPTLPPHKGNRPDLAYHMTVVRTANDRIRSEASEAIAPHLPRRVTGTEMWASEGSLEDGLRHAVVLRKQRGPAD
jgi:2'-5' RNA ligase superfamily